MKKVFSLAASPLEFITMLGSYVLFATLVLLPLLFLPMGQNFLVDSKMIILFLCALLVFTIWGISTFVKKTLQITLSPFFLPLLALAAAVLISGFFNQAIPMNQLLGFGGVYLAFVVIAVLAPTILPRQAHKAFLPVLAIPTILLAFTEVAELLGFGPSRIMNMILPFGFPASPLFSLTGSPLIAAEFLALVLGASVVGLATSRGGTGSKRRPLFFFLLVAAIIGMGVNARTILQENSAPFMTPFGVSWSIATDMLKSFTNTVVGVGPNNFSHAYLILKPAWVNNTTSWNITYTQPTDLPLAIFVTLGALGLAAWLWLSFQVLKFYRRSSKEAKPIAAVVVMALILELFLPPSALILGIQALAMAFWVLAERKTLKSIQMHTFTVQITESDDEVQKIPRNSHFLVYLSSVICVLIVGMTGWWLGRYMLGQYFSFLSMLGTAQNNALIVYTNQQRALEAYPYLAQFRRDFSNTSMIIALNMASQTDLTDQEKQQTLSLVQQAIDQSKVATSLEPSNSLNWVNLARIYSNLIGTAEGADSWAISAYSQAINTAPTDPILRLEVGGLLYRLNQPQEAVQVLQQAVNLKPNWPNAYYNLANAYKLNKEPEKAVVAYQQTLALLQDSPEQQQQVQSELEQLQKEIAQPKSGATMTPATGSELLSPTATTPSEVSPAAKDALKNVTLDETQNQ